MTLEHWCAVEFFPYLGNWKWIVLRLCVKKKTLFSLLLIVNILGGSMEKELREVFLGCGLCSCSAHVSGNLLNYSCYSNFF